MGNSLTPIPFSYAANAPFAEVDGVGISQEEVEAPIPSQIGKLEEQIYNRKRQRLEGLISDRLLAKEAAKRKVSVPALIDAEVTSKVGLVTEQEIETVYQANRTKLKGEEIQVREQIRSALQNQKLAARRQEFLNSLRADGKIVVHLKPPPVVRA